MEKKEEFIRVGTTLYKIVDQPRIDGGYVRKRIAWNSETLRQDYGKDYMAGIPKYDGFCTVPDHVGYKPVVGKFLNLYEPISHVPVQGDFPASVRWWNTSSANSTGWVWTIYNCSTSIPFKSCPSSCSYPKRGTREKARS